MEKRVILAIVLMIAVMFVTNLLFPPAPPPQGGRGGATDTVAVEQTEEAPTAGEDTAAATPGGDTAGGRGLRARGEGDRRPADRAAPTDTGAADTAPRAAADTAPAGDGARDLFQQPAESAPGDTVTVTTPLYEYRFSTRGATLVGAELTQYASYVPNGAGRKPAQLVRDGDRLLGWQVTDGRDTLDLRNRIFEAADTTLRLSEGDEPRSLTFRYPVPGRPEFVFRVTYTFRPDSYTVDVEGALEGLGQQGYSVITSLGRGLRTNEADPDEDYGQLGFAVNSQGGEIHTRKLDDIESGERVTAEGGPFRWVAVKNKYFVIAYVAPESISGFGGLIAGGLEAEHAAEMQAALPVPAGEPGFRFEAYVGPQEYDRLSAVGHELQNVNPIGYDWLRFIIRPLANLITAVLTWMHSVLGLAYGWVLILFGILMRVVLFPLYQKSMRAQMAQMQVQPLLKEIQEKYADDKQKQQEAMMRLYKEHDINPLAGCLPMLLPFPVLITLFFVFQSTIEFRGVPFLWIPDLSLQDPLFVTPIVMGLSMFAVQWIGQRGMERNTQMKIMSYAMPVVFTAIFWQFPAGLNLYYATSNLASLPQQWYLSKERREAKQQGQVPATS